MLKYISEGKYSIIDLFGFAFMCNLFYKGQPLLGITIFVCCAVITAVLQGRWERVE